MFTSVGTSAGPMFRLHPAPQRSGLQVLLRVEAGISRHLNMMGAWGGVGHVGNHFLLGVGESKHAW